MLYKEPVGTTATGAIVADADQHPAPFQARAVELESKTAVLEHLLRRPRALRLPIAAVPQLHRPAAVLSLGDGPLEVAIIEWVILDLDCKTFVLRIERGPARDRP